MLIGREGSLDSHTQYPLTSDSTAVSSLLETRGNETVSHSLKVRVDKSVDSEEDYVIDTIQAFQLYN